MRWKTFLCGVLVGWLILSTAATTSAQTFPSFNPDFPPPAGWSGRVFQLSQNYPTQPPTPEARPWESIDFRQQPFDYMNTVLAYALEGNTEVDFEVQNNVVRTWYHTPWLHTECNGREFIRGLTRERVSRPRELHPLQSQFVDNWAVGFYNAPGGHTIGQVWNTATGVPDPSKSEFPVGTVAFKLLFTTASVAMVPFLQGSLEWEANVYPNIGSNPCGQPPAGRQNQTVRLLQIDVAIRDERASPTGWAFGTFIYDASATGATVWDRMVPVGLMWGNDPTVNIDINREGAFQNPNLSESAINLMLIEDPQVTYTNQAMVRNLGLGGRLNGPVDNPISSCSSCHGRGGFPSQAQIPSGATRSTYSQADFQEFFENVPSGAQQVTTPSGSFMRLDYSLQIATGLRNYCRATGCGGLSLTTGGATPQAAEIPAMTREGIPELASWTASEANATEAQPGPASQPGTLPRSGDAANAIPTAMAGLVALLVGFAFRRRQRSPKA